MNWISLIIAGICEMIGVVMMHRLYKDRNWKNMLLLIAGFGASFLFLSIAMKTLPMGISYAVWTGIGASGGAILGMIFYGEPKNLMRILCITLILGSAVGLKLVA
ncbi:QacE family quaternary ammonium compound efflux SMR transporter [Paenibacillus sp. LMG 31456]|uniref:QacE family quaternary ammonium compound efflux SMR transporter n=1 Tax=Paenibacillus foliorum TaxID=2654974 RepID=A0A972GXP7_9BACL|nr:multidrug efflux SMR transporter [Paenibacillus foliorum]NOU96449.1 QacE family quaternary ammonium compound efflux SMR transporter [Paenibacillus foliorum]